MYLLVNLCKSVILTLGSQKFSIFLWKLNSLACRNTVSSNKLKQWFSMWLQFIFIHAQHFSQAIATLIMITFFFSYPVTVLLLHDPVSASLCLLDRWRHTLVLQGAQVLSSTTEPTVCMRAFAERCWVCQTWCCALWVFPKDIVVVCSDAASANLSCAAMLLSPGSPSKRAKLVQSNCTVLNSGIYHANWGL